MIWHIDIGSEKEITCRGLEFSTSLVVTFKMMHPNVAVKHILMDLSRFKSPAT